MKDEVYLGVNPLRRPEFYYVDIEEALERRRRRRRRRENEDIEEWRRRESWDIFW